MNSVCLLPVRLGGQLVAYRAQIAAAIEWMLEPADGQVKRVDVINASLGSALEESKDYRAVMRTARNIAGIVTVAAIGNDGAPAGRHLAPAALDFVVAVGAVDHRDEIYVGSAWGPGFDGRGPVARSKPDLVAPGVAITSARPANPQGELVQRMTGTSQATPLVTGAAALLIGHDPSLRADPDRLVAKLLSLTYSSQLLPHYGVPERFGVGRLDLGKI